MASGFNAQDIAEFEAFMAMRQAKANGQTTPAPAKTTPVQPNPAASQPKPNYVSVKNGQITQPKTGQQILSENDQLKAEMARLQAENERLKAQKGKASTGALTLKVSEKGALSVYGLGRFPQTLYKGQWKRLLKPENVKGILDFIEAHAGQLASKEGEE